MRGMYVVPVALLVLTMLAGPVAAFCSGAKQTFPQLGTDNAVVRLYPEASSETTGALLSLSQDAGAAARFKGHAEASGLSNGAAAFQRQPIPSFEFPLTAGLPYDAYLNLSKPIVGTLYWTSTTATAGRDPSHIRLELLVGTVRAGGVQVVCGSNEAIGFANPVHFSFRPEVDLIPAGEPVKLRITRLAGSTDFFVGTGGSQQSFVELHYFHSDPLASALYLEDRHLVPVTAPPTADDGQGAASGAALAFASLPAGILALRNGKSRRTTLLLVLALGLAASGCLAGAPSRILEDRTEDPPVPTSSAEIRYEANETLRVLGAGAIEGLVRDAEKAGIPIDHAYVALAGTTHFAHTGPNGTFAFGNLTPRSYLLHADKDGFLALEQNVDVRPGEVAHVEITLTRPASPSQWRTAHVHDDFLDQPSLPLWEDDMKPTHATTQVAGTYWFMAPTSLSETEIPLDLDHKVPPGTKRVEVVLSWGQQPNAPLEFGLRITTGKNVQLGQTFVPRPSGEPFRIAIFPDEADLGHQQQTSWRFWIAPLRLEGNPAFQPAYLGTEVHYKMTAFKGVVPYEPPHPKFWNGRSEIVLLREARLQIGAWGVNHPDNDFRWRLEDGARVPPGTAEVRGYLRWSANPEAPPATWSIAYKPANAPDEDIYAKPVTMGSPGSGANNRTFSFVPTPAEFDQYYQAFTRWQFFPSDDFAADDVADNGRPLLGTSPHSSLWLTAFAVRDPAFQEI